MKTLKKTLTQVVRSLKKIRILILNALHVETDNLKISFKVPISKKLFTYRN